MTAAPETIIRVKDPVTQVEGFLVVHSKGTELAFGGTRFSTAVNEAMVKELAACMAFKLAGHGTSVGGAKAGISCAPDDPRLHPFLKYFAEQCGKELSTRTILGKDLGASDALLDELYQYLGKPQLHVITPKGATAAFPTKLRDLNGYKKHMTGLGVAWAGEAAARSLRGKRVIIQGAGHVGAGTAIRMEELGAVIVGISDIQGAVFVEEGVPAAKLVGAISGGGVIVYEKCDFSHRRIGRDELFAQKADIVVLAAASNSVRSEHAQAIQSPLVVEGSNFGLLPEARKILFERGISVVPDVIASSSSAAMVAMQMASKNSMDPEKMWELIRSNINKSVETSVSFAKSNGVDLREAYLQAVAGKGKGE